MRTLFHLWLHPFSRKVRIVLAEKSLDFTPQIEKVWERRTDFLALNPAGDVPVLIEKDGTTLANSQVICEYLEEYGDAPPLLPKEGRAHWEERSLDAYAHALMDSIAWRLREYRKAEGDRYQPFIDYEKTRALRCFAELEERVDELQSAEISLGRILLAIACYYQLWRWPDQDWRNESPRLAAWYEPTIARSSIAPILPK